jgi:hypothetical protein
MTDGDMLAIAVVALAIGYCIWEHPSAAKEIGMVVLIGLVCFGAAHAQTHARRHHRRGSGRQGTRYRRE